MKCTLRVLSLIIIAMFSLGLAQQQQMQAASVDELFVLAAAQGDLYEINSSQLATERTSNEGINSFAQQLIIDHTVTSERLSEIAAQVDQAGVDPVMTANAVYQLMLTGLTNLQGEEFDREFVRQQVLAHQVGINLYRIAAESAQNEELRAFAIETLPVLRGHLQTARSLMQELGMTDEDLLDGGQGTEGQGGGSN